MLRLKSIGVGTVGTKGDGSGEDFGEDDGMADVVSVAQKRTEKMNGVGHGGGWFGFVRLGDGRGFGGRLCGGGLGSLFGGGRNGLGTGLGVGNRRLPLGRVSHLRGLWARLGKRDGA
jgi:hypothetical protein